MIWASINAKPTRPPRAVSIGCDLRVMEFQVVPIETLHDGPPHAATPRFPICEQSVGAAVPHITLAELANRVRETMSFVEVESIDFGWQVQPSED